MAVPKEILSISRPKNTIVYAYGKNKDRYAVKQRTGCKYINGRSLPITSSTIGHIINGKYIPINNNLKSLSVSSIDLKDWANIILCDIIFKDIYEELKHVYNEKDSLTIYCISILHVCYAGIKDYELKEAY